MKVIKNLCVERWIVRQSDGPSYSSPDRFEKGVIFWQKQMLVKRFVALSGGITAKAISWRVTEVTPDIWQPFTIFVLTFFLT